MKYYKTYNTIDMEDPETCQREGHSCVTEQFFLSQMWKNRILNYYINYYIKKILLKCVWFLKFYLKLY